MSSVKLPRSEIILYQTEDGRTRIECRFEEQTVWLTQALMAELFQVTSQNVTLHIKSIYADGELEEAATCKEYLQVRTEGGREVTRALKHYSLPVILAVGYRVRSHRGTQFRQWATSRLNEYLVKGFTMDDERLDRQIGRVPDTFRQEAAGTFRPGFRRDGQGQGSGGIRELSAIVGLTTPSRGWRF